LRLDKREFAESGGESGGPVLGGDLQSNEVFRRATSDDVDIRMPKDGGPLSAAEIAVLERWVNSGTPWPEDAEGVGDENRSQGLDWWTSVVLWLNQLLDNHDADLLVVRWYCYALLPLLIGVLFVERAKTARKAGRLTTSGRFARLQRVLCCVPRTGYLLAVLAIVLAATTTVTVGMVKRLQAANVELRAELSKLTEPSSVEDSIVKLFGDPPVPFRPSHPSRLGGEYYRGNCERNPNLYNNGNYCTAVMRLTLCDANRRPLARGDRALHDALLIHYEIERAPFAAPQLFTATLMEPVFLSRQFLKAGVEPAEPRVKLETVETSERWAAYWRVPAEPDKQGRLKGVVYIYPGGDGASPHYAVSYDLLITEGIISDDSELWMNAMFVPSTVIPPSKDRVPFDEWFDHRPLPEIVGGNTSDPKLLGVEEHLGKEGQPKSGPTPHPFTLPEEPANEPPQPEATDQPPP
jgi:hypothetical protein